MAGESSMNTIAVKIGESGEFFYSDYEEPKIHPADPVEPQHKKWLIFLS